MTLFELQEHCLANAVDAEITDGAYCRVYDRMTGEQCGEGYLDEPTSWLAEYDND